MPQETQTHPFIPFTDDPEMCVRCHSARGSFIHDTRPMSEPHPFVVYPEHPGLCQFCFLSLENPVHDPIADEPERPVGGYFEQMVTLTPDGPQPDGDSKLRQWWTDQAFDEADRTIAKMEKYGSMDLVHIGRAFWEIAGRTEPLTDVEAMELGCLFYVYGKVQRAMSAVKSHQPILSDTWFDMHIYPKMAEAARAGVWPL